MKLKNIRISSPNLYKLGHSGSYQLCGLNPKVPPMPSSLVAYQLLGPHLHPLVASRGGSIQVLFSEGIPGRICSSWPVVQCVITIFCARQRENQNVTFFLSASGSKVLTVCVCPQVTHIYFSLVPCRLWTSIGRFFTFMKNLQFQF